jgi:hypothetical protein
MHFNNFPYLIKLQCFFSIIRVMISGLFWGMLSIFTNNNNNNNNNIIIVVVTIIADKHGRLLTQLRRKLESPATQTLCTLIVWDSIHVYMLVPQHAIFTARRGEETRQRPRLRSSILSVRCSLTQLYPPHRDHFSYLLSKWWIVAR